MNQKHLTQIWLWASLACMLYLLASVVSLQGGTDFLGRLYGDKSSDAAVQNRPAVGYFSAIVGGALLLMASFTLALHACRHGSEWHARIPVVWLEGLNTHAWEAKLYQGLMLLVFLALPLAGIVVCMKEAEDGDICEQDTKVVYPGGATTLLWPPNPHDARNQMRLRKAGSRTDDCKGGIEIFPRSLTPLLFYGLPLGAGAASLVAVAAILRRSKPRPEKEVPPEDGDATG